MANYLTVNSVFNPYSFDELLRNAQMATEAHYKVEDELGQYADNASLVRSLLNEQDIRDKDLIDSVNNWSGNLEDISGILSSKGLSEVNRQDLFNLKRQYASKIAPIQLASEKREKDRAVYKEATMKDDTLVTSYNPYNASLSEYMGGESPYMNTISGSTVEKDFMGLAAARSSREYSEPLVSLDRNMQGQYYRILQRMGYTNKQAEAILNDPNFLNEVEAGIRKYDLSGFDSNKIDQIREYAISGYEKGLSGKQSYDWQNNKYFDWMLRQQKDNEGSSQSGLTYQDRRGSYSYKGTDIKQGEKDIKLFNTFDKPIEYNPLTHETVSSAEEATRLYRNLENQEKSIAQDLFNYFGKDININIRSLRNSGYQSFTDSEGNLYEIQYNNYDNNLKVVKKRVDTLESGFKDKGPKYIYDENATALIKDIISRQDSIDSNRRMYKNYGLDKYEISKKEESRIRKDYDIPDEIPLSGFSEYIRNHEKVKGGEGEYIMINTPGELGERYKNNLSGMIQSYISNNIGSENVDNAKFTSITGKPVFNVNGYKEGDRVEKLSDIFTFDPDSLEITNVRNYTTTLDLISKGYIVVETAKKGKIFNTAIPIDFLGSSASVFNSIDPTTGKSYLEYIKEKYEKGDNDKANEVLNWVLNNTAMITNENTHYTPSSSTKPSKE